MTVRSRLVPSVGPDHRVVRTDADPHPGADLDPGRVRLGRPHKGAGRQPQRVRPDRAAVLSRHDLRVDPGRPDGQVEHDVVRPDQHLGPGRNMSPPSSRPSSVAPRSSATRKSASPMKLATKRLAGWWNTSCGVPELHDAAAVHHGDAVADRQRLLPGRGSRTRRECRSTGGCRRRRRGSAPAGSGRGWRTARRAASARVAGASARARATRCRSPPDSSCG